MIRLFIADDHQVLLDGFISIFNGIHDIQVLGTGKNGQEVLDYLEEHEIDVLLLDINMPILNGVETCKKVTKKHPKVRVVALSMYDQQSYFKRMFQYGASGYLLKNDPAEEILTAIREVAQGNRYVSKQLQERLRSIDYLAGSNSRNKDITSRELEVLRLVADGFTDQQIADQLYISFHTVNSHRKNLLSKFGAKNTAELVKKTLDQGIM